MVLFDTIKDSQIFYVKSINCYELSFIFIIFVENRL